ncbi:AarF/UbiB family protein [Siccirubricoccus deserti]
MCRELGKLQYRVAGFPADVARRVVEEHLGRPLSQVFADFEPLPFAAASVCQVHRATLLRNGRAVVVKIRRPDIRANFERDMRVLRQLCPYGHARHRRAVPHGRGHPRAGRSAQRGD